MAKPQQPELQRSGHTWVDPDHASEVAERGRPRQGPDKAGPVPPDNQPGHHADVEQDKPQGPPDLPDTLPAGDVTARTERFPFQFDARLVPAAAVFGVLPSRAYVEIDGSNLFIRFGQWSLRTPLANVRDTEPSGPYRWWKVAGPAHLSLADGGITFATTTAGGLCIRFHEPVPAALPTGWLRHPAATVTVASPQALADAIAEAQAKLD